jgi:hypothetical protein
MGFFHSRLPSLVVISLRFLLFQVPLYSAPCMWPYLFTFTLFNLTENFEHGLPRISYLPFPAVTRIDSGGGHISVSEDMSIELLPTLQKSIPTSFLALFPRRILFTVPYLSMHVYDLKLLSGFLNA